MKENSLRRFAYFLIVLAGFTVINFDGIKIWGQDAFEGAEPVPMPANVALPNPKELSSVLERALSFAKGDPESFTEAKDSFTQKGWSAFVKALDDANFINLLRGKQGSEYKSIDTNEYSLFDKLLAVFKSEQPQISDFPEDYNVLKSIHAVWNGDLKMDRFPLAFTRRYGTTIFLFKAEFVMNMAFPPHDDRETWNVNISMEAEYKEGKASPWKILSLIASPEYPPETADELY
jgi:hypothetical protein